MATLKDVAKLACVDVSTVSRALNNTSYVHPETKKRILEAVKKLSYHPNVLAQGLKKGKRQTIGIVVPRLHFTLFSDITQSIELEAKKQGYAALICHTEDDPEIEKECLNRLKNGFVDGIIIAGSGQNKGLLKKIDVEGIPVVQIVRKEENSISSITADYYACGYETVKYLVKKGCKEIGLINGPTALAPYRERYLGYKAALEEEGLQETTATAQVSSNSFEYGYECTETLLKNNSKLDAIMAAVDIQGVAAIRVLKTHGISVPRQMRLVSLTGYSMGNFLETSMTSFEIPGIEMGKKATQMLIEAIEGEEKPSVCHLVFPASLVEREST